MKIHALCAGQRERERRAEGCDESNISFFRNFAKASKNNLLA